jgi:hypothetical protein
VRSGGASALWLLWRGVSPGAKQEAALPPSLRALLSERRCSRCEVSSRMDTPAPPCSSSAGEDQGGCARWRFRHELHGFTRMGWPYSRGGAETRNGWKGLSVRFLPHLHPLPLGEEMPALPMERGHFMPKVRVGLRPCPCLGANPCRCMGLACGGGCGPCRVDAWDFAVAPRYDCRSCSRWAFLLRSYACESDELAANTGRLNCTHGVRVLRVSARSTLEGRSDARAAQRARPGERRVLPEPRAEARPR